MSKLEQGNLKHGLSNRHIQLIALGGAIGTGLFLGISQSIKLAGPSVILGYAIAGFIAFLMMRQLGEMVVQEPVSGSFSHFAYKYWGSFAGFMSGWNYWVLNILVCMAELSAIGLYIQYWWPEIPTWASALVFFLLINGINLLHVKLFGEMEFWFSIVKILAILAMIGFGSYLLATGTAGSQAGISNLWALGGFFPFGVEGLVMAMAVIIFAFGGIELFGITAAEARDPDKTLPKAVNQIIYRILIFYIATLFVLFALFPWNQMAEGGSPFVMVFASLDSQGVATMLNFVILTAAVSVYNGTSYCSSRMLLGLAQQGNAPKFLKKINKNGIPTNAVLVSAFVTVLCVILNYIFPEKAFGLLMMLVVAAIVINWIVISWTHLKFRKAMLAQGETTKFPSIAYPFSNYLCIVFMLGILVVMSLTADMRIAVMMIPAWILCLMLAYAVKLRKLRNAEPNVVLNPDV
ncbi:amino acid permease [Acinetobacter junii]|uniref:Aromatic amino acid transport protein AroP n=1 Tax=Acinetobacter junii SH205 TaxID=575587 RepID=D0SIZ4_ACIJU|nr:amino acid permease [Acinetobacter junii]APU48637.1 aromatic amino acid transporter AroP [Acinetobacter junii]EEY93816.1 aromatic amino acid transport protein AroP [Acinetobacter junii SH205]MCU4406665.1 amino acid permease [Acinetobacter junii]MDH1375383.1 amino acid permease [Acinetobacter junii]MEB8380991.1 amino acid permease [Acinetobacter junii]